MKKFPIRLDDISFTRPDGRKGLLGFTINPVQGDDIDRGTVLLFGADITHRRQVEGRIGAQAGGAR